MPEIIWDFNDFMSRNFKTISLGLTPSGNLHLGFLCTLACALMYLKEHPRTQLIITNMENSLDSRLEKYSGVPLRFQYLEEGELIIPKNYNELKRRNRAMYAVHGELKDLIWKLITIFDARTADELRLIEKQCAPEEHKKWLELKENKVFHLFSNHIYVYSFLSVLENDRGFRNNMIRYITDIGFARAVAPILGFQPEIRQFGGAIVSGGKRYQPTCFQIPIRLYCPTCNALCPNWAVVVLGHPEFKGPTLAAPCENSDCPRAQRAQGYEDYNTYVYHNLKDALDMAEFHFMLNSMRGFFDPFKTDCHIFGGDYFQLEYEKSGMIAIDKIAAMFSYLEENTKQNKAIFGGPLITINGKKMSKTGTAFNLNEIKNIRKVFLNVVMILEEARAQKFPKGLQIEYTRIISKVA